MPLLLPQSLQRCRPLLLTEEDSSGRGRLGGLPPRDVRPSETLTYFATLPISESPDRFASIFVSPLEALMPVRGVVNDVGFVQLIPHAARDRAPASPLESPLTPLGLQILEEADDWIEDPEEGPRVRSGHKLGGQPFLVRRSESLARHVEASFEAGFRFLIQIDFPGGADADVSGPWPFGDGIFGALGREPFGTADWRWWWDY